MSVVNKDVLKSYFNDGDVPRESNYVDLIDSMGDLISTSVNRPGVIKVYRRDSDVGDSVQVYWDGSYWVIRGYDSSNNPSGTCRVALSDLANAAPWTGITGKPSTYPPEAHLHDSDYHRKDSDVVNAYGASFGNVNVDPAPGVVYAESYIAGKGGIFAGSNSDPGDGNIRGLGIIDMYSYIHTDSFVDADSGYRVNGQAGGIYVPYTTANFKTHSSWTTTVDHATGQYTLTPAMFGYPSNAKSLYVLLQSKSVSGAGNGYVGINDNFSVYSYPLSTLSTEAGFDTEYGNVHLDGSGNMLLRVGTANAYVNVQVWGYYI